jgi:hypothetical protein
VVPDNLPAGWPGLLRAMTAREPQDRPLPAEAAAELHDIANGGQATTVMAAPVAAPVENRTSVLSQTRVAPLPEQERVVERPVERPVARAVAPAPRNPWPWVLALLAVAALIGAGVVYASQQGGTSGPLPAVDADVPEPLRGDLERLKAEVDS